MTNTIYDITHESDAILLVGSNPEHAHPVIGMQVRQAVQRGAKLIVVDPRDIDLCKDADIRIVVRIHDGPKPVLPDVQPKLLDGS